MESECVGAMPESFSFRLVGEEVGVFRVLLEFAALGLGWRSGEVVTHEQLVRAEDCLRQLRRVLEQSSRPDAQFWIHTSVPCTSSLVMLPVAQTARALRCGRGDTGSSPVGHR